MENNAMMSRNRVKGHRIIPIWLTFLLSSTFTTAIQTKPCFQEANDMSRAEPVQVLSTNLK